MRQKKIKTTLVALMAAILFLVVFAACGAVADAVSGITGSSNQNDDIIVGAWWNMFWDNPQPIEFLADGTVTSSLRGITATGYWHREGEYLILTSSHDGSETRYAIEVIHENEIIKRDPENISRPMGERLVRQQ